MGASGDPARVKVTGWSVDTRTQAAGDVYFALRGPNFDGHEFARAAADQGASAVVVERPAGARNELVVSDSLCALQQLANRARREWGGTVVGVTGSAGNKRLKSANSVSDMKSSPRASAK